MENQFERTSLLLGEDAVVSLSTKRVAVFGIGGVGGYVCEALVRSGVGAFDLIDNDKVSLTNLNRQIIACHSSLGRYKVDVMKERMLDINPEVDVRVHKCFFLPDNADSFSFSSYDYVVDAVDTVTGKIELVLRAKAAGVPVISAMGAGNKLDPTGFKVADIYETKICPLARVMRRELKKRGIQDLKVVYSEEKPASAQTSERIAAGADQAGDLARTPGAGFQKAVPGSVSFVPSVCGLIIAGEVIKDLINT